MVIRPPVYTIEAPNPILFLGGPIKGARDWQSRAITFLQGAKPDLTIACPRTISGEHGEYSQKFTEAEYNAQADWEFRHLERALESGVVLFWMGPEDKHFCERGFAQTTRVEFGDALRYAKMSSAKLAIGVDPSYPGMGYAHWRVRRMGLPIRVQTTLENTCLEALELLA